MSALWSAPRRTLLAVFVVLLHLQQRAFAQDFDCHVAFDGGIKFDLTSLGERTVSQTREMPPSRMVDEVRFNLCQDLEIKADVAEGDQVRPCSALSRMKHV